MQITIKRHAGDTEDLTLTVALSETDIDVYVNQEDPDTVLYFEIFTKKLAGLDDAEKVQAVATFVKAIVEAARARNLNLSIDVVEEKTAPPRPPAPPTPPPPPPPPKPPAE